MEGERLETNKYNLHFWGRKRTGFLKEKLTGACVHRCRHRLHEICMRGSYPSRGWGELSRQTESLTETRWVITTHYSESCSICFSWCCVNIFLLIYVSLHKSSVYCTWWSSLDFRWRALWWKGTSSISFHFSGFSTVCYLC